MRDTTIKRVTTRGGHNIPGELAPGTPKNCRDCGVRLVAVGAKIKPDKDVAQHRARGYCNPCYYQRQYADQWDGPAPQPRNWKSRDLAAEYLMLRRRYGFTYAQAAERLGVKTSRIVAAVYRARRYDERDRQRAELEQRRAEIAQAEAEAHRINDDMIAYAIRKARAA